MGLGEKPSTNKRLSNNSMWWDLGLDEDEDNDNDVNLIPGLGLGWTKKVMKFNLLKGSLWKTFYYF